MPAPMKDTGFEQKTPAAAAGPPSSKPNGSVKQMPAPVEDTGLQQKTPAAAAGPASSEPNASVKQMPALVEDTGLERKTTAAAAGPASFEPNASLKRSPAPVEDTSLERKTPAAAVGPTSADSNAFVKQHRSGSPGPRRAVAQLRQRSRKIPNTLQKDTADLSAKDERELAEPYSPPIVMSLAASPEKALDPSNLSAATVELPGSSCPYFWPLAIVAIFGAIIFTIVVRGHHAFKPSYLKNTANASGTVTPAE
ncbi:hypothetical protein MRX96_015473 [Rhipicephalus microplus]